MLRPSTRLCALSFVIVFAIVLAWLWPLYLLFDSDSSYHLAIAREYAHHGMLHALPWARFSIMRDGFGDKELVFHLLLAPLAAARDFVWGGKLAVATLVAVNCCLLFRLAWPALGPYALYLPALLLFGALSFDLRLIRLRPELLALPLMMGCLGALAYERYLLVFVLSALFALSYTAVHALLGLCTASFLYALWVQREPRYRMLAAPWSGSLLGLLVHPHFPHNLRVFYLQNVAFWRFCDQRDVGDEIHALSLSQFLRFDSAALLGLALLTAALTRRRPNSAPPQLWAAARVFSLAALAFAILFACAGRFSLYAWPFLLLAWAYQAAARGYAIGPRLVGFGPRAPRTSLALLLVGLLAMQHTHRELTRIADLGGCVWPPQRRQLERFGRAVPPGAKIAAPWSVSEDYVLFAPQGRYLNLLDPVFMRSAYPGAYTLQRRLFQGELDDVPLALAKLDSDYLAFSDRSLPQLAAQVRKDPRLSALIEHGQVLYRVRPDANRDFVLDYRIASARGDLRGPAARRYQRARQARARQLEGVVDGRRFDAAERCVWLAPVPELAPHSCWELGSTGALTVYRGDKRLATHAASERLVLGAGTSFAVPHDPATAAIELQLCSGQRAASFYLVRRTGCPLEPQADRIPRASK